MNTNELTINHPANLVSAIGAASDVVLPIHIADGANHRAGLVRVYEPRRACEYWVHAKDIRPQPSKRW